jgi:Icc-related predicted phosphoesterase
LKIVALSDTHSHNFTYKLKGIEADLLVLAGDMTNIGTGPEILELDFYLSKVKSQFRLGVLAVAGNHDRMFDINPEGAKSLIKNIDYYLDNQYVEIEGVKFWGSPQQPYINEYWTFGATWWEREELYATIPLDTDVVVTHGAPDELGLSGQWGDPILTDAILKLKPKVHIFGHCHSDEGDPKFKHFNDIRFYNVSMCDNAYRLIHEPTVIEV